MYMYTQYIHCYYWLGSIVEDWKIQFIDYNIIITNHWIWTNRGIVIINHVYIYIQIDEYLNYWFWTTNS